MAITPTLVTSAWIKTHPIMHKISNSLQGSWFKGRASSTLGWACTLKPNHTLCQSAIPETWP